MTAVMRPGPGRRTSASRGGPPSRRRPRASGPTWVDLFAFILAVLPFLAYPQLTAVRRELGDGPGLTPAGLGLLCRSGTGAGRRSRTSSGRNVAWYSTPSTMAYRPALIVTPWRSRATGSRRRVRRRSACCHRSATSRHLRAPCEVLGACTRGHGRVRRHWQPPARERPAAAAPAAGRRPSSTRAASSSDHVRCWTPARCAPFAVGWLMIHGERGGGA